MVEPPFTTTEKVLQLTPLVWEIHRETEKNDVNDFESIAVFCIKYF